MISIYLCLTLRKYLTHRKEYRLNKGQTFLFEQNSSIIVLNQIILIVVVVFYYAKNNVKPFSHITLKYGLRKNNKQKENHVVQLFF